MSINKSLELLDTLAKENGLSRPYIVGGVPRNAKLEGTHELSDIDITTGDDDVHKLARLFADAVGKDAIWQKDHYTIIHNDIKYDFAKHTPHPGITDLLKAKGIENPTEMEKEVYSRDFTMNTLLMPTDQSDVIDITGKGLSDIENKIITCPISCDASFQFDPRRILRAYYFKVKYDFSFSDDLNQAIQRNKHLLESVNKRYSSEMLNKIVRENSDMIHELIDDGILKFLPITKYVNKLLIEKKRLLDVMDNDDGVPVLKDNADYGEGWTKKVDEAREDEARDHNLVNPIESAAYCNKKDNNDYWAEMGDSEAAKDFQEYAKKSKCSKLNILNNKTATIRGPGVRECPYGLPIAVACQNAGDSVKNMTELARVDKEKCEKQAKANKRVYLYNQTGQRCIYADKIAEGKDRVHCDHSEAGAGISDSPMRPSPFYPRVFHGLGQYGLYSYPIYDYMDVQGAMDTFSGVYSVYAASGDVEISKTALPVLEDEDLEEE